jgi:hypothetical protein
VEKWQEKTHAPAAGHAAGINCMRGKKKKTKKAREMIDSEGKAVEASVRKIMAP